MGIHGSFVVLGEIELLTVGKNNNNIRTHITHLYIHVFQGDVI